MTTMKMLASSKNDYSDLFSLLDELDDSLIEFSIILRKKSFKESLSNHFNSAISDIISIIEELDELIRLKDFSSFTQDDANTLNVKIKNNVDDISIMMVSFDKKNASNEEKLQYDILLKDLSVLEKLKVEVENTTGFHILKIQPTLHKGKKLIVENLSSFLKDFQVLI